jgi:ankyrin repeat protein
MLVRFAALGIAGLFVGGTATSCSRRPASSGVSNDAELQSDAVSKWNSGIQAKREALAQSPEPPQTLMEAAQLGDVKGAETLLARAVDRRTLNEALLVAAESEPLIVGGVNAQNEAGLLYASTVRLLLSKGASVRARDENGSTALARASGHGETAVVKLLLEKGAEVEATDSTGTTALIAAACDCPIIDQPATDDSVRLLLGHGANIEASNNEGTTALMAAAGWGRASIAEILLDRGAKIDARDRQGNTALLISAKGSAYPTAEAVGILLARGADIEARNSNGDTALMLAASNGGFEDVKIVQMLLNRGADLQARDRQGRTAIDRAAAKKRGEIVLLLKSASAKRH